MKLHLPLGLLASLMACFAAVHTTVAWSATPAVTAGSVVFIGDSITQGAGIWDGKSAGYRYQVFKNYVDNGVEFNAVGSWNAVGPGPCPDYGTKTWDKDNEGHSGWWASDLAGKTSGGAQGAHEYLANWLGQTDQKVGSGSYAGTTYNPESVYIMAGTNDFGHQTGGNAATIATSVVDSLDTMITMLKTANPNVKIYIGGIPLRSTGVTIGGEAYNTAIDRVNSVMKDSTKQTTDGYTFIDTMKGIRGATPTDSAFAYQNDGLHPNVQGELILAGNIARGMGIGQRNVGQTRMAVTNAQFTHKVSADMTSVSGTAWASMAPQNARLVKSYGASSFDQSWTGNVPTNGYTCEVSLQMFASNSGNVFNILMGDGVTSGLLSINQDRTMWGNQRLYNESNTLGVNDFRVSYIKTDAARGFLGGYYVWRNGVLIGEALSSNSNEAYAGIKVGNLGTGNTFAGVTDISWNTSGSVSPDYSALDAANKDVKGTERVDNINKLTAPENPVSINWPDGATAVTGTTDALLKTAISGTLANNQINAKITSEFAWSSGGALTSVSSANTYIELTGTMKSDATGAYLQVMNNAQMDGNLFFKVGETGRMTNGAGTGAGIAVLFGINSQTLKQDLYMEFAGAGFKITGGQVLTLGKFGCIAASWDANVEGSTKFVFSAGEFGAASHTGNSGIVVGGTMSNIVGGHSVFHNTLVDISGGTFYNGVAGGGYNDHVATTTLGDSSTVKISGGTISGNIFGGSVAGGNVGTTTIANGSNVLISGGTINASIYGGNNDGGTVFGNTNVTFSNIGDLSSVLTGGANQVIAGGNKTGGEVKGAKTLTFDKSSGTVAGTVQNFDKIVVNDGSTVALAKATLNKTALSGAGSLTLQGAGNYDYTLAHTDKGTVSINNTDAVSTIQLGAKGAVNVVKMDSLALATGSIVFDGSGSTFDKLTLTSMSSTGKIELSLNSLVALTVGSYDLIVGDLSHVSLFELLQSTSADLAQKWSINQDYKTSGKLTLTVAVNDAKTLTWGGKSGSWTSSDWASGESTAKFTNGDKVIFDGNVTDVAISQDISVSGSVSAAWMSFTGNAITYNFMGGGNIVTNALYISGPWIGNQSGTTINIKGGTSLTTVKYRGADVLSSSATKATNYVNIGGATAGTLTVTGTGSDDFVLSVTGHGNGDDNKSVMTILENGQLIAENTSLKMDKDGSARLTIDGGSAKLLGIHMGESGDKKSELRLTGGGTLNIGTSGITNFKVANDTLNWGDGTIGAWGSWTTDANISLGYRADTSTGTIATTINTAQGTDATGYTVTLSGVISELANKPGALIKNGAGTLVLSGANTYSGGTAVNAGTLQISNSSALGTGMTTVASGATLEATSAMTLNVSKLDIQKGSILKHGANAITLNTDSTTSTFNGDFNGAATLTINGGGTLVFNGIHKKDGGDINITGATLDLSQGGRLFNGGYSLGHLFVNTGGKLVLNSWEYSEQSANLGGLTNNNGYFVINGGTVRLTATTSADRFLSLNGTGDKTNTLEADTGVNWTFSRQDGESLINGAGSLTKTGAGAIILNTSNTYAGGTIIKEGTVKVGNLASTGTGSIKLEGAKDTDKATLDVAVADFAKAITITKDKFG
ncbi:MAG: GDSL-type esterase/lipase family protein, partial [Akkermansia sp.]